MSGRFTISDRLWEKIEPLIPARENPHPRGGGRKPKDNRTVMNAIFFVLRTGCQWNALNATGICASTTAHTRFQKWVRKGVFLRMWERELLEYDMMKKVDWSIQAMDGAMTKAPLGGKKDRQKSNGSR